MCATYRDKQRYSHFESFANKIYTGIRELNYDYAEKRAIWELFQNALDTLDKDVEIEIAKTEKGLLFKHNGSPFKDDEFGGLIKQFSVGKTYGDNRDKLGQYGTGFISTHVYGKKIEINGSIQTDDGTYRTLKGFNLDRVADNIVELTHKLMDQDDKIAELCDNSEAIENHPVEFTTFEYIADTSMQRINSMLQYIQLLIPYIFCFNDKLKSVLLKTESEIQSYKRISKLNDIVVISLNDDKIHIPILSDTVNNVRVILGSSNNELINIPKQFLFYPLMETTNAGYNFIIHANDFRPNKERDYLHLDRGSEELKSDVKTNESLLKSAFNLVKNKVLSDESLSISDLVKLEFRETESAFIKSLKTDYIDTIKDLKNIPLTTGEISISQLKYFDKSILSLDESKKKSIYSVLKQFLTIPSFEMFCELSEFVNNWNTFLDVKFDTLELTNIAKIVAEKSDGNYLFIDDKKSYIDFISEIATDITLLNSLALIPNMHGDFKEFESLVKWENEEDSLIRIVDSINAYISENYIHKDFTFLNNLRPYNRDSFKKDFNDFCNDFIDDLAKGRNSFFLSDLRFERLIQSLSHFIGLNKKTLLNVELVEFYNKVFKLIPYFDTLLDPTVDINYQPAIKLLANLYIKNLSNSTVKENIADLKEWVSIMYKNTNLREELLHKLACLPNQNYILKSQSDLKKDNVKDSDFKDEWDRIVRGNIRDDLAYEGFEVFLQHGGQVSGSELGSDIEHKLNKDRKFIPVDKNIIDTIINLIEKISSRQDTWGQWLREINLVKEEILMYKFQDESTRQSLFNILSIKPEKINLLGELAKIEDLNDLIRAGKQKQREEIRHNNHLQHINYIGLKIQDMIQRNLNSSLAEIVKVVKSSDENFEAKEEQNGQDFIIYKSGKPIYFIEVKSKWDENGRFALSKNQTERCASEKGRYAVITVNVDRYKRKHSIDVENIPFEDLYDFVKVNDNLGEYFEELISENLKKSEQTEPKLIEYRGSIPQKMIDSTESQEFDEFITKLISIIK